MLTDYLRESPDGVALRISAWRRWLQSPGNRAKTNAKSRRYSKTAQGRARHVAKSAARRAAARASSVLLSSAERLRVADIYAEAQRLTRETGVKHHVDHDRPLARGGKHHPDNLIVVPAALNLAKGAKYESTMEFLLS